MYFYDQYDVPLSGKFKRKSMARCEIAPMPTNPRRKSSQELIREYYLELYKKESENGCGKEN